VALAFDLLLAGEDIRRQPLIERKTALKWVLRSLRASSRSGLRPSINRVLKDLYQGQKPQSACGNSRDGWHVLIQICLPNNEIVAAGFKRLQMSHDGRVSLVCNSGFVIESRGRFMHRRGIVSE